MRFPQLQHKTLGPTRNGRTCWGCTFPRALVACEFSGRVRDALKACGWDAWSCDLLPTESPGQHIQGDIRDVLEDGWDLMIAHPPCTHLSASGARWWHKKQAEQAEALEFVDALLNAPIPYIALENPVGIISTKIRKPDQVIQPWQFGHGETKTTHLWLKGLPALRPTHIVEGREPAVHRMSESKKEPRWQRRSRTYPGIAQAMAGQWSEYIESRDNLPTRTMSGSHPRSALNFRGAQRTPFSFP